MKPIRGFDMTHIVRYSPEAYFAMVTAPRYYRTEAELNSAFTSKDSRVIFESPGVPTVDPITGRVQNVAFQLRLRDIKRAAEVARRRKFQMTANEENADRVIADLHRQRDSHNVDDATQRDEEFPTISDSTEVSAYRPTPYTAAPRSTLSVSASPATFQDEEALNRLSAFEAQGVERIYRDELASDNRPLFPPSATDDATLATAVGAHHCPKPLDESASRIITVSDTMATTSCTVNEALSQRLSHLRFTLGQQRVLGTGASLLPPLPPGAALQTSAPIRYAKLLQSSCVTGGQVVLTGSTLEHVLQNFTEAFQQHVKSIEGTQALRAGTEHLSPFDPNMPPVSTIHIVKLLGQSRVFAAVQKPTGEFVLAYANESAARCEPYQAALLTSVVCPDVQCMGVDQTHGRRATFLLLPGDAAPIRLVLADLACGIASKEQAELARACTLIIIKLVFVMIYKMATKRISYTRLDSLNNIFVGLSTATGSPFVCPTKCDRVVDFSMFDWTLSVGTQVPCVLPLKGGDAGSDQRVTLGSDLFTFLSKTIPSETHWLPPDVPLFSTLQQERCNKLLAMAGDPAVKGAALVAAISDMTGVLPSSSSATNAVLSACVTKVLSTAV